MMVSMNMAMSLDGKIATRARGPIKLGSKLDSRRMAEIRALHDAVINGAATFAAYPFPLSVEGRDLIAQRTRKGQAPQPISAVSSSRLQIPLGTPWEKAREIRRWIFCGREAPLARVRALEKGGVEVKRCRGLRPGPKEILAAFAAVGARNLLLEGGGEFNSAFFEAGLVNRVYLTLTPLLIGGAESPTWFEGKGFAKGHFPRFRLVECRPEGHEIYLVYER
jgi:riboflavin-specific deaminase-like protein